MPTFETVARRHLLNSTAVSRDEYKWNGDPSEWESWPVGRPGPFVSEPVELNLLRYFKIGEQNHFLGPPDEPAFHIAKFSDNGQGQTMVLLCPIAHVELTFLELFCDHVSERELAEGLNVGISSNGGS